MSGAIVKNAWDAFTSEHTPAKNYSSAQHFRLRAHSGNRFYGWIFFTKPFPPHVTILTAQLVLHSAADYSGSATVTVQRISEKFAHGKLNWNNQPAVTGGTVAVTKSNPQDTDQWVFDVTTQMQTVANGAAWYGFRIVSNTDTLLQLAATQAVRANLRPYLLITWSDAPDKPENLQPAGARTISISKPTFSFDYSDPAGEDALQSVDLQVATSPSNLTSGTYVWDLEDYPTSAASIDSDEAGWSGGTSGNTYYWRIRATDASGATSVWSDIASFTIAAKGSLSIEVDGDTSGIKCGQPTVSWTFTGQTQRHYQVILSEVGDDRTPLWDSGKITSTITSITIPWGILTNPSLTYRVRVRIWDDLTRQGTPGDPVYKEEILDLPVIWDNTVAAVTGVHAVPDPVYPTSRVTWTYTAGGADYFQILWSDDGTAWYYGDQWDPDDAVISGSSYGVDDASASPNVTHYWKIVPVVDGVQGSLTSALTATGLLRRIAPMLMSPDRSGLVLLLNPDGSRQRNAIQDLIPVLSGPSVLVSQFIGSDSGHASGVLADNVLVNHTAKDQLEAYKSWIKNPGQKLKFFKANEVLNVVCYNMEWDSHSDNSGVYYSVEFDWIKQ